MDPLMKNQNKMDSLKKKRKTEENGSKLTATASAPPLNLKIIEPFSDAELFARGLGCTMMNAGKVRNGGVSRMKYFKTISCSNGVKKKISSPCFPEEIIFNILVWVPADCLYNSMRYVCWQWYNIIHDPLFIKEQFLRPTAGLFIKNASCPYAAQFVELGKMNVTVTEVSFPFPNEVLDTCDGLVLFRDLLHQKIHVANPLTKERVTLPPVRCPLILDHSFSLVCARSKTEYKVLCTYRSNRFDAFVCLMVTLGKDLEWKLINCQNLTDHCWKMLQYSRLSRGGFLYWAQPTIPYIVTLDVESEMFYKFSSPLVQDESCAVSYVARGKSVACTIQFFPGYLLDVWVLSDPMRGGWKKLYKIEFAVQKHTLSSGFEGLFSGLTCFKPIVWVNNGEVGVFCVSNKSGPYIAHNVRTGVSYTFGSFDNNSWYFWRDYAHSFVSLTPS